MTDTRINIWVVYLTITACSDPYAPTAISSNTNNLKCSKHRLVSSRGDHIPEYNQGATSSFHALMMDFFSFAKLTFQSPHLNNVNTRTANIQSWDWPEW